jgi:RHS repeat-associated protein
LNRAYAVNGLNQYTSAGPASFSYDANGNLAGDGSSSYGQSRTFSDLYYNRYRDYDPTTGRYIQADPIGLAGGANPYSYAMNNPLRYTDPLGLAVANTAGAIAKAAGRRTIPGIAIDGLLTIGKTIINFCQGKSGDGDRCDELYREMEAVADDLARRYRQFKGDAGGLLETKPAMPDARYGTRSRTGEAQQFYQQQSR